MFKCETYNVFALQYLIRFPTFSMNFILNFQHICKPINMSFLPQIISILVTADAMQLIML